MFVDKFKYAKPPYHTNAMAVYDATSPEARKYYWDLVNKDCSALELDAWWMDTTEPETEGQEENILLNHKLAAGSGNRYVNVLSAAGHAARFIRGSEAHPTRSACLFCRARRSQARNEMAVTAWSGDINSDWFSFRRQIPAGLNFAVSGIPYWTTDIGGFVFGSRPIPPSANCSFAGFSSARLIRSCAFTGHGIRTKTSCGRTDPDAQKVLVNFDRLRYRMLPYIYSLAWKTTSEAYTPMRPLVMDFRTDVRASRILAINLCSGRRSW